MDQETQALSAISVSSGRGPGVHRSSAGLARNRGSLAQSDMDPSPSPTLRVVLDLASDLTSLAISSSASRLAATSRDRPVCVWDESQEKIWKETRLPVHQPCGTRSLSVSPDGTLLAAGNVDGTVSL